MSISGISIGPVRQLSLQPPAQPRRHSLRRQRSADDERSLNGRGKSSAGKSRRFIERPKVRVAWTEYKNEKPTGQVEQVEVVARQIPGRSRPTTGRSTRSFSGPEKPSILYSREELAERLRLAWKHRQENRANIDIFLAHRVAEERCESALSHATTSVPVSAKSEDPGPSGCCSSQQNKIGRYSMKRQDGESLTETFEEAGTEEEMVQDQNRSVDNSETERVSGKSSREDFSLARQKRANFQSGSNKAFLRHIKAPTDEIPQAIKQEEKLVNVVIAMRNKEPVKTSEEEAAKETKPGKSVEKGPGPRLAAEKRETFANERRLMKNSSESRFSFSNQRTVIQRTITTDSSLQNGLTDMKTEGKPGVTTEKNFKKDNSKMDQRTRRTNSAPPHRPGNRVQVNIVIDTPNLGSQGKVELNPEQKESLDKPIDLPKVSCPRPTRSAPLKRRTRSGRRRQLAAGSSSKSEEKSRGGKGSLDPKPSDVVTMVSLVSSADSDSETENSPLDDKLINELRNKLPTTSIIKSSIGSGFTATRKTMKSVSFQRDSFEEEPPKQQQQQQQQPQNQQRQKQQLQPSGSREEKKLNGRFPGSLNEESTTWRTDVPGLALPVLASIHDVEEVVELPLTDREKRCLAVPIGDLQENNRKLARTRATSSKGEVERRQAMDTREQTPAVFPPAENSSQQSRNAEENSRKIKATVNSLVDRTPTPRKEGEQDVGKIVAAEPQFQTDKEKECWHLYKKMCDKGVCVSFDTVLRGMLTPTEYRLRQRELLQDF